MKCDYWAIYNPEYGYYLGKKPDKGSYKYGGKYVFGWNLRPCLYKTVNAAEIALKAIPEKASKEAIIIVCSVDFPYDQPIQEDDLFKDEV